MGALGILYLKRSGWYCLALEWILLDFALGPIVLRPLV